MVLSSTRCSAPLVALPVTPLQRSWPDSASLAEQPTTPYEPPQAGQWGRLTISREWGAG